MWRAIVNVNFAAQRIAFFHRLNFRQYVFLVVNHHAGKSCNLDHAQTSLQRSCPISWREWMCGDQAQIGTQQAGSFLLQHQANPVGKQPHGSNAAYCQHQSDKQHAPFTGAPVPPQHEP